MTMDRFSSVSGIPVLKIERQTAEFGIRLRIPFFISHPLYHRLRADGMLPL